jgi:predicted HAD superfamily phosphohydrolase YqeG
MITKVKYTDLDNTQVKITLNDGREMFTGVEGATWLHTELNEWLKSNTPLPFMTEEELAQKAIDDARANFKQERAQAVAAIVVEVDGLLFDGDETSQTRMARAAVAMTDEETIQWVLADNTLTQCTKAKLIEALRLAGAAQTAVWVMP